MDRESSNPIRLQTETINPYRFGLHLMLKRLQWDLHPQSWASRRRIRRWKDRHAGERCIILCNGPSLNEVNFKRLEESGIFCIGLNKINLLFDKISLRPHIIAAVNRHVLEQNARFYNSSDIPMFLNQTSKKYIRPRKNIHFLHCTAQPKFARDCTMSIQQGYTVTYVALQIAFHIGFSRVALVGCDHSFAASGPPNAAVQAQKEDVDHFDKTYFSNGMTWHLPDLKGSEYYYNLAAQVYKAFGREIYNATAGGKLDIFPRIELEEFIA